MYLIYIHNLNDNNFKPLDFSETSDEALKILEEIAKEFIVDNEGKKKWDSVFIEDKTDINKLKDGYYFIKKDCCIKVYNKISETVNTGWILNSQEVTHKIEHIFTYNIAEFQRHLLNKFITSIPLLPTPPSTSIDRGLYKKSDIPDKIKPSFEIRTNLDDIISEIKRAGFKPIPRKVKNH